MCQSTVEALPERSEAMTQAENQYWWSLVNQRVEQGAGSPNAERLGPYATYEEAAAAIERTRARAEAAEADDREWGSD